MPLKSSSVMPSVSAPRKYQPMKLSSSLKASHLWPSIILRDSVMASSAPSSGFSASR